MLVKIGQKFFKELKKNSYKSDRLTNLSQFLKAFSVMMRLGFNAMFTQG